MREDISRDTETTIDMEKRLHLQIYQMLSQMQDMVADHLKLSQEFNTESQIRMRDLSDMVGSNNIRTKKNTLDKDPAHRIPENEQNVDNTATAAQEVMGKSRDELFSMPVMDKIEHLEQSGSATEGMEIKNDTSTKISRPENNPDASSHRVNESEGVIRQGFFSMDESGRGPS